MRHSPFCLSFLGFFALITPLGAVSSDVEALDRFIEESLKLYGVPGAAVAVIEKGEVVLLKGYGVREYGKPERVDENTIFQLASVSKTFTAASAALMVDEGKITWDTPICLKFPEFEYADPYPRSAMTLRDLLAHRTGWPEFTGDLLAGLGYSRREMVARLKWLKPAYTFREVAQYSNPGFFIAGEVTARVAGMEWETLVHERLLKPLNMTRSGTSYKDLDKPNSTANHNAVSGRYEVIQRTDQDSMGAAGAVTSTATDLVKWMRLFLQEGKVGGVQILKPETIQEMFKRSMVSDLSFAEAPPISEETGFYYGLGFGSYDYADVRVIEKGGALAGVRTILVLVPSLKSGIVVMANLNFTALPERVRAYWLGKLLNRPYEADIRKIDELNDAFKKLLTTLSPTKLENATPYPGSLSDLVGVYENNLYGKLEIALEGDSLWAYAGPARFRASITHYNHTMFQLKWPVATAGAMDVWTTLGDNGKPIRLSIEDLGDFERVEK